MTPDRLVGGTDLVFGRLGAGYNKDLDECEDYDVQSIS